MISAKNCRGRIAGRCRGSAALSARRHPTAFSPAAVSEAGISEPQVRLIADVVDRSPCTGLSRRFQIASAAQPADLTVRAFITRIIPTDEIAAAASSVTSVGMTVVKVTGVVTAPIPSLRFMRRRRIEQVSGRRFFPVAFYCAVDAADPWISVLRTSQDFAFVRKPDVMAV